VAEDGDLALDDFLLGTGAHVARDVLDDAFSGTLIEDLLPQGTGGVEVLLADLGKEGDSLSCKVTVGSVEVESTLTELSRLDGRKVGRTRALVVEGHASITLEVADSVRGARSIDGQLLVVDADAVTVSVRV